LNWAASLIAELLHMTCCPVNCNSQASKGMALCLVVFLTLSHTCLPYAAALAPPDWHSLELRDAGMTASVTTRIDLKEVPQADVQSFLIEGPEQLSPRVAASRIQELAVTSKIRLLLTAGIETRSQLWFNVDNGLPLQLVRTRLGSRPARKIYRFGNQQVYRLRSEPAHSAESAQPPEEWTQRSESFYPLPDPDGECPAVLESSQLLYLLTSQGQIGSGKPEALCVFDRKRVYRVDMQILGREQLAVDYLQVIAGRETRVRQDQEAFHLVISGEPEEDSAEDKEPFSFLGLQGEIHLLLSDPGRVPLQIRGEVPGNITVQLELVELTR
jgi:hypothetical protein